MPPNLHRVWLRFVSCHLLVEDAGCVLIDTGLIGGPGKLRRLMARLGRPITDIRAILLTHGHLDHAAGLAKIKAMTGAAVYAHPEEQAHLDGTYPYTGWSRVCGGLEAFGRRVLRYKPVAIDEAIEHDQVLPFAGGLRVVHLPGHSAGHCGFYWEPHDLLFAGDALISTALGTKPPPAIFNSVPDRLPESFDRIRALDPALVLPNHYDVFDPAKIGERVRRFLDRSD